MSSLPEHDGFKATLRKIEEILPVVTFHMLSNMFYVGLKYTVGLLFVAQHGNK